MNYKIVVDSCCDLTPEYKNDPHYQIIPLTLQVDDVYIVDDETFDQAAFIKMVKESSTSPKSACSSPESYKKAYECEEENVFVVTLSEHLSGSYNSAVVAKNLYIEEHGPKNIAVISSHSASVGESQIAFKIQELCEKGLEFEEIVRQAEAFRDQLLTFFVLESLDILKKNGRLTGLQAFFATALNIKPVMAGIKGVIQKLDQARGINKALIRMCEIAAQQTKKSEEKLLAIAHCNCPERAEFVKKEMLKRAKFSDVYIVDTAGVATMYGNDGGIIMSI